MDSEEYPAAFVGLVTAVLIVEMVLGLLFNVSVLVVSRGRLVSGAERGNTFLASLSVVDIIACLSALPLTLVEARASRYHDDLLLCLFTEGAVALSSTASSLTLLLISLERYQAVTRPAHRGVLSSRPAVFLTIVWSLSFFTFGAPFFLFNYDTERNWNETLGDIITSPSSAENITENITEITTTSAAVNIVEMTVTTASDVTENMTLYSVDHRNVTSSGFLITASNSDVCAGVSCGCPLISIKFFRIYEVVYVAAFFLTSFAMAMFCLAIMRVVRRRVAAKEAAAMRKTAASAAVAGTSRDEKREVAGGTVSNSGSGMRTMATLEVPAASSSTAVSEERERETEGVETELRQYASSLFLSPHVFGSVGQSPIVRFIKPEPASPASPPQPSPQPPQQGDTQPAYALRDNEQRVSQEESWVQRQQQRQQRQQRRRRIGRQEDAQSVIPGVAQQRRVLRVSLGIASAFLFCWGPHMVLTLVEMVVPDDVVLQAVHVASLLLAYATVVIHPLIYAFSRKQFREALSRPWRRYRVRRQTTVGVA
ncbi:hypothetical protein BaRGS_00032493 [Batillaria attramentaria]|uniref:G-protein coupled receptors family 1 profile domain-containing protein n=1 Tax=Batillaria attramentaria TaxID=370345 RepID=A0ABD0JMP1_9CAEN|nr:hypothetical protein BaRGS_022926 [Batillaria attramentaria]